MKLALGVMLCMALLGWMAKCLVPMVVTMCHKAKIIFMYSAVAYQSSKPHDIRSHIYFVFILIGTYPRLMEICRQAEDHEPKL